MLTTHPRLLFLNTNTFCSVELSLRYRVYLLLSLSQNKHTFSLSLSLRTISTSVLSLSLSLSLSSWVSASESSHAVSRQMMSFRNKSTTSNQPRSWLFWGMMQSAKSSSGHFQTTTTSVNNFSLQNRIVNMSAASTSSTSTSSTLSTTSKLMKSDGSSQTQLEDQGSMQ